MNTTARDSFYAFHAAHLAVGVRRRRGVPEAADRAARRARHAAGRRHRRAHPADLGSIPARDTHGRFTAAYTLTYEIRQPDGEWVRIVRGTDARGIELLGRKLAMLSDYDVQNIAVKNRAGSDCTFDFECFREEEREVSPRLREFAYGLMSFVPTGSVTIAA